MLPAAGRGKEQEMKKVEFSGGNRILSAKALRWYDGMDQDIYVDANSIYYIGGSRERIGTLAELDAAFCQFQDDVDAMDADDDGGITVYMARTTFPGAYGPTEYYFSTREKAREFLDAQDNGDVTELEDVAIDALPYEGCTWDEILYEMD